MYDILIYVLKAWTQKQDSSLALLFDSSINSDLSTRSHFSINRSTLLDQQQLF